MHPTLVRLLQSTPVLTDGAWGTQLQALGLRAENVLTPGISPIRSRSGEWPALCGRRERGDPYKHLRSNRIALEGFGLAEKVVDINTSGVRISREAAAGHALVFASIGPTGKMLMTEEVSPDEMLAAFTEQAAALASAGADALVIETMSDLEEAKLAVRAARTTGLPVVASMVFDSGKDKDRTMMGSTPEQVAEELAAAGADVIGQTGGLGMEGYIPIARRLRAATHLPIWIKPNAGLPEMVEGKVTYRTTPEEFARQATALRDAGVAFVGGCCGTTPSSCTHSPQCSADVGLFKKSNASNGSMKLNLVSCEVLYREICHLIARSPHQVDLRSSPKVFTTSARPAWSNDCRPRSTPPICQGMTPS